VAHVERENDLAGNDIGRAGHARDGADGDERDPRFRQIPTEDEVDRRADQRQERDPEERRQAGKL